jgi:L-lactate dehydrogenase complex protein LldG
LTQHLVLVLDRESLVPHLHQAYERLGAAVGRTGYGCFLCGPSKTADIEQALVVGAHGPRSLVIVLFG